MGLPYAGDCSLGKLSFAVFSLACNRGQRVTLLYGRHVNYAEIPVSLELGIALPLTGNSR